MGDIEIEEKNAYVRRTHTHKLHSYGIRTLTEHTIYTCKHSTQNVSSNLFYYCAHAVHHEYTQHIRTDTHTNDEREAQIDEAEKEGETERTTKKHAM